MPKYEVRKWSRSGEVIGVYKAKSALAARKQACRDRGSKPADPWCGVSIYFAKRLKGEEANG